MRKLFILQLLLLVIISLSCNEKQITEPPLSIDLDPLEVYWCWIPSGPFTYGNPAETLHNPLDFWIMQYEVTNYMYVDFLNHMWAEDLIFIKDGTDLIYGYEGYVVNSQTQGLQPQGDEVLFYRMGDPNEQYFNAVINWIPDSFQFDIKIPLSFAQMKTHLYDAPVTNVTWWGAWAFAFRFGWRLPTEYEWECAARANTGYDYPWGNEIDSSNANYTSSKDPYSEGVTPVGFYNGQTHGGILNTYNFQTTDSKSPSFNNLPYPLSGGVYDMAGNVWEWCDSWIAPEIKNRVKRGGSWYGCQPLNLRSWLRNQGNPEYSFGDIGFRCVSDRTAPGQLNEEWRLKK